MGGKRSKVSRAMWLSAADVAAERKITPARANQLFSTLPRKRLFGVLYVRKSVLADRIARPQHPRYDASMSRCLMEGKRDLTDAIRYEQKDEWGEGEFEKYRQELRMRIKQLRVKAKKRRH
jgi:hypothetical protein